jgi:peptidylprolyl isomerase
MQKFKNGLLLTGVAALLSCNSGQMSAEDAAKGAKKDEKALETKTTPEKKKVDLEKLSETFGYFIGKNLNTAGMKFDIDLLIKGIRDGAAGKPAPMSETEYMTMINQVQENLFEEQSENNLAAANKFMKENEKASGVIVIVPEKLQYNVMKQGSGEAVEEHGTPLVHYVGKYLDGTTFGSSEETKTPIKIALDQTIPGFSKGIVGMKEGERRKLFIHPDLGYGTSGQLSPNALLIFEVEVIKAKPPKDEEDELSDNGENSDDEFFDDDLADADNDGDDYDIDEDDFTK